MIIILKQEDITKAIRQSLEKQGISLRNKEMKITFTNGRGDKGISAELNIQDVEIPGYTLDEPDTAVVTVETAGTAPMAATTEDAKEAEVPAYAPAVLETKEPEVLETKVEEVEPVAVAEEPVITAEAAQVKTVGSLFGS